MPENPKAESPSTHNTLAPGSCFLVERADAVDVGGEEADAADVGGEEDDAADVGGEGDDDDSESNMEKITWSHFVTKQLDWVTYLVL